MPRGSHLQKNQNTTQHQQPTAQRGGGMRRGNMEEGKGEEKGREEEGAEAPTPLQGGTGKGETERVLGLERVQREGGPFFTQLVSRKVDSNALVSRNVAKPFHTDYRVQYQGIPRPTNLNHFHSNLSIFLMLLPYPSINHFAPFLNFFYYLIKLIFRHKNQIVCRNNLNVRQKILHTSTKYYFIKNTNSKS